MKLLRYGPAGAEKPGLLEADGTIRDLSGVVPDLAGPGVALEALDRIRALDPSSLPIVDAPDRFGACLGWVPNFHCVGLNYAKHAEESGAQPPKEPILFSKATSALAGPNDDVVLPDSALKADWEVPSS